jgi:hypothetical protein
MININTSWDYCLEAYMRHYGINDDACQYSYDFISKIDELEKDAIKLASSCDKSQDQEVLFQNIIDEYDGAIPFDAAAKYYVAARVIEIIEEAKTEVRADVHPIFAPILQMIRGV